MTEWLLGGVCLLAAAQVVVVGLMLRGQRTTEQHLRILVRYAGSTTRVTSVARPEARDAVHLVLMDDGEKRVDYVMVVDPAQRAQTVTYGPHTYGCASGSVEDGYFVYRKR